MPVPPVRVVAPPPVATPKGPLAAKFAGADAKCAGLADAYRAVAEELGCPFFDAATVTIREPCGRHSPRRPTSTRRSARRSRASLVPC
jgi:hypothetical protein